MRDAEWFDALTGKRTSVSNLPTAFIIASLAQGVQIAEGENPTLRNAMRERLSIEITARTIEGRL